MHAIFNLALVIALISPASAAYASNLQPESAVAANVAQSDYYEQPSSGNAPSFVAQTPPPPLTPSIASDSGSAYPMKPLPAAAAVNNVRPPPPAAVRSSNVAAYRPPPPPPPPAQMVAVRPRPLATMQEIPCDHTMTFEPQAANVVTKTVTVAARPTTVIRTVTRSARPTAQAVQPTYTSVLTVAAVRPTAAAVADYEQKVLPVGTAVAADKDCEEPTGGALADAVPMPRRVAPRRRSPYYPRHPWGRRPMPNWPREDFPDDGEFPGDDGEFPEEDDEEFPEEDDDEFPNDDEELPTEDEELPTEDDQELPSEPTEPIDEEPFPPFEELPVESFEDNSTEIEPHHFERRSLLGNVRKSNHSARRNSHMGCVANTLQCSGRTSFQVCQQGKWIKLECAAGTFCTQNGSSVRCRVAARV